MEAAIHSAHRRRGNNEGSIKKRRDGRWEAQYSVKRPTDGKTVRRSVYGKSRQEVQEKLQEILVSIHQDEYIEPSRITVEQWLHQWLRVYCLSLKKNSTCTGYEDEIKLHIVPYLGSIRLQDLKPQQVQLAVNALVQQGKAPATVRKAHAILHAALRRAVIDQMIKHNPSEFTVLPKMERRDIHYLTQTEQKRFIQHLPDCSVGRALYFILGTGIRAGELSGLRWSDVQDDRFTVRQTVRRNRDFTEDAPTRTHLEFGTPKSNAGHRTIPLTTRMQKLILEHQQLQAATRRAKGEEWNDHDLVFCTEIGTPYELRNLNRVLHRTLKKANLHTMGVHSLRHSFATRAVEAGMDIRTLSEILGHTQVSLTMQLYVHSNMETKKKEMEKLDAFL